MHNWLRKYTFDLWHGTYILNVFKYQNMHRIETDGNCSLVAGLWWSILVPTIHYSKYGPVYPLSHHRTVTKLQFSSFILQVHLIIIHKTELMYGAMTKHRPCFRASYSHYIYISYYRLFTITWHITLFSLVLKNIWSPTLAWTNHLLDVKCICSLN